MSDSANAGSASEVAPRCKKCGTAAATLQLRNDPVCGPCLVAFVKSKAVKRIEALRRMSSTAPVQVHRYLLALSPPSSSSSSSSSAVLLHALHGRAAEHAAAGRRGGFELVVATVDAEARGDRDAVVDGGVPGEDRLKGDSRQPTLECYPWLATLAERYPLAHFICLPLAPLVANSATSWLAKHMSPSSLSPTAYADLLRLHVRRTLLAEAARRGCDALLLGSSATALAECVLAETAKGRGRGVGSVVGDGIVEVADLPGAEEATPVRASIMVFHPLRELLRSELLAYAAAVDPPLIAAGLSATNTEVSDDAVEPRSTTRMSPSSSSRPPAVVSHRDLTIDEVVGRFFSDVEAGFPSIVANVVRTVDRLDKPGGDHDEGECGLCGMPMDSKGDERWIGEVGEDNGRDEVTKNRNGLCYGCRRIMHG